MRERPEGQLVLDVAIRIRELREAHAWTQAELATALDISDVYVRRLEAGKVNVSIRALARLAHALGVPAAAFFERPRSRVKRAPGRPRRS